MKLTLCSALVLSLALVSCQSNDPDYQAYKKQQEAAGPVGAPYGANADPYGAEAGNSYGVPGQGAESGSYQPAPHQPLPAVNPNPAPLGTAPSGSSFPTIPSDPGTGAPAPIGPTTPHVVQSGDSLWGLSRKFGTSVDSIKQANGLSGDKIVAGTTLQIPTP